jgi:hypothetical protein
LNPQTLVPVTSTLTTRPPMTSENICTVGGYFDPCIYIWSLVLNETAFEGSYYKDVLVEYSPLPLFQALWMSLQCDGPHDNLHMPPDFLTLCNLPPRMRFHLKVTSL